MPTVLYPPSDRDHSVNRPPVLQSSSPPVHPWVGSVSSLHMVVFAWIVLVIGAGWALTGFVAGDVIQIVVGVLVAAWGWFGVKRAKDKDNRHT